MKKSRIAKLALMGASITALAATLTTSTYAWYVSNREANVTKTEASTGSANADSSVLLSWSSDKNFGKEINFKDSLNHPVLTSLAFQPVHEDEGSFYGISATDYYSKATTASTNLTHYLQFTLYAKTESADGVDVTVNFTINNKTTVSSDLNQIAMVPAAKGAPTSITQGSTFYKDCIDAMYVRQSYSTTTETLAATSLLGTSTLTSGKAAGGNAHTYYKNVQGWDADGDGTFDHTLWAESEPAVTMSTDATPTPLTAFSSIHLTTTALAITYTIWLDGGDVDCFNSCANQTIDFAIKYTVA